MRSRGLLVRTPSGKVPLQRRPAMPPTPPAMAVAGGKGPCPREPCVPRTPREDAEGREPCVLRTPREDAEGREPCVPRTPREDAEGRRPREAEEGGCDAGGGPGRMQGGEEVKRRSLAAVVINAPGVFTNSPPQACVEAGLGEGGCVHPGPPGARLHPQRGRCFREAPNPHSSPQSRPREPWEAS